MKDNRRPRMKEIYVHGYLTKKYYYDKYGNLSTIECYTGGYIHNDEVYPLVKESTIRIFNHGKVVFFTTQNFDTTIYVCDKVSSREDNITGYVCRHGHLDFESIESSRAILDAYRSLIDSMAPIEDVHTQFKGTDVIVYYRDDAK